MGFSNLFKSSGGASKLADLTDVPAFEVGKYLQISSSGDPVWNEAVTTELNYSEVDTYADLPTGIAAGTIYIVNTTTGIYGFRNLAGFYQTDGTKWSYLGAGDWVDLGSNQSIAGIKTFNNSPIVPAATIENQAVNKSQLDAIALTPGPQGIQGIQGSQGVKGDTGLTGTAGTNGVNSWSAIPDIPVVVTTLVTNSGNAVSAAKLQTARTIALTGSITGSAAFDGSSNISITTSGGGGLTDPTTTQGDIIYRNATGITRLPAGTAGQVLSTGGIAANPSWISNSTFTTDITVNGITIGQGKSPGNNNTAIGNIALSANTNGYWNVAIGRYALNANNSGYQNTATGYAALSANTNGNSNTATGTAALCANTTGNNNAVFGYNSLALNISGSNNTANGCNALQYSTISGNNTAIGYNTLPSINGANTTWVNCSALGNGADVTGANQVQLGNSATTTYAYGAIQARSDSRDKTDIQDTVLGLDWITKLHPVDYKWDYREDYQEYVEIDTPALNGDGTPQVNIDGTPITCKTLKISNLPKDGSKTRNRFHHGLIAQEVQQIIKDTGVDFGGFQDHNIDGGADVLSIGYEELIGPMIKAIQELKAEIDVLQSK